MMAATLANRGTHPLTGERVVREVVDTPPTDPTSGDGWRVPVVADVDEVLDAS